MIVTFLRGFKNKEERGTETVCGLERLKFLLSGSLSKNFADL